MADVVDEEIFSAPKKKVNLGKESVKPPKTRQAPKNYEEAVNGLLQVASVPLLVVSPPDFATVALHGPNVAKAVSDLANDDERVAAILDKFMQAGPYAALLAAVVPLGLQVAANHGVVKPGMFGTHKPEELVAAVLGGEDAPSDGVEDDSPLFAQGVPA